MENTGNSSRSLVIALFCRSFIDGICFLIRKYKNDKTDHAELSEILKFALYTVGETLLRCPEVFGKETADLFIIIY